MTMMKKLIFPFKLFIQELRKDHAFRKTLENKKIKSKILGAMGQSCIVLFGLVFMYYYTIYITGVTIFTLEPLGLIGVFLIPLMIWVYTSACKKLLIQNKIGYIKEKRLYDQYKEATKHIEEPITKNK